MTATTNAPAKAPTPVQVDALIDQYAKLKDDADAAATVARVAGSLADEVKVRLVTMVEAFGSRHTEKSKRLAGIRNTATTTTATRTSVDDAAVENFRSYLDSRELTEVSGRFFVAQTTYSLVQAPAEVLKTLSLGKKIREKMESLIGLCFKIKTNAPSLKVERVDAA